MPKIFTPAVAILLIPCFLADPVSKTIFTDQALGLPMLSEHLPFNTPSATKEKHNALSRSKKIYLTRMGQRLADLREKRGIPISALARAADVTVDKIAAIERGRASGHLSFWLNVARCFNVPLEILLDPDLDLPEKITVYVRFPTYACIVRRINDLIVVGGYTQKSLALRLGIKQPKVSLILRQLRQFAEDTDAKKGAPLALLYTVAYGLQQKVSELVVIDPAIHKAALLRKNPDREKPTSPLAKEAETYLRRLGERIKFLRKKIKLTLADLGNAIHSSDHFIGHLERAEHWPPLSRALKLANFFNIPPELLLDPNQPLNMEIQPFIEPMDLEHMGPRIDATIKNHGLSQFTLARFIGITQPSVANALYELRHGKDVSLLTVFSLAWATQMSMHDVLQHKLVQAV